MNARRRSRSRPRDIDSTSSRCFDEVTLYARRYGILMLLINCLIIILYIVSIDRNNKNRIIEYIDMSVAYTKTIDTTVTENLGSSSSSNTANDNFYSRNVLPVLTQMKHFILGSFSMALLAIRSCLLPLGVVQVAFDAGLYSKAEVHISNAIILFLTALVTSPITFYRYCVSIIATPLIAPCITFVANVLVHDAGMLSDALITGVGSELGTLLAHFLAHMVVLFSMKLFGRRIFYAVVGVFRSVCCCCVIPDQLFRFISCCCSCSYREHDDNDDDDNDDDDDGGDFEDSPGIRGRRVSQVMNSNFSIGSTLTQSMQH